MWVQTSKFKVKGLVSSVSCSLGAVAVLSVAAGAAAAAGEASLGGASPAAVPPAVEAAAVPWAAAGFLTSSPPLLALSAMATESEVGWSCSSSRPC